jgi:hypothetical protein
LSLDLVAQRLVLVGAFRASDQVEHGAVDVILVRRAEGAFVMVIFLGCGEVLREGRGCGLDGFPSSPRMQMETYPSVAGVPLPPKDLLFMDKTAAAGLEHGKKLITLIQQRAGIGSGQFLDIGCGWGRAAYGLLNAGFGGRYVGFEVLPTQIDWLRANFSSAFPSYRFEKTHIKNAFEKGDAGDVSADLSKLCKGPLDIAIALSIFTHLYESTVIGYIEKVFSLLSPGRPFVFTAFLLNDESESLVGAGKGYFKPTHQLNDHCSIQDIDNPRRVIAYSEKWLLNMIARQGYNVDRVYYGNWCGRDTATHADGQDWVVLRKP